MSLAFLDTNILVYLFDEDSPDKQAIAQTLVTDLVAAREAVLSTQVLQEFYWTVTRRLKKRLDPEDAEATVRDLAMLPLVQVDKAIIFGAMARVPTSSISFWEALIIESALSAGAERLLSEDLQHGQVIDGMRIENPFLG